MKHLMFTVFTFTIGCNAITGIDDYQAIGVESNDAGTDQVYDQAIDGREDISKDSFGLDSRESTPDTNIADCDSFSGDADSQPSDIDSISSDIVCDVAVAAYAIRVSIADAERELEEKGRKWRR